MTNKERSKRGLTTNSSCPHCSNIEETVEHILQKCKKIKGVLRHFKDRVSDHTPIHDFKTWLVNNMKDESKGTEFGIICWCIWKQRNEEAMDEKTFSGVGLIKRIESCFSINTNVVANVASIEQGTRTIRERRKVEVNLDSTTAVSILKGEGDPNNRHDILILQAKELLRRDWIVKINHVYRECNYAADILACKGHEVPFGTHHLDTCDPNLMYWLNYDVRETSQERDVLRKSALTLESESSISGKSSQLELLESQILQGSLLFQRSDTHRDLSGVHSGILTEHKNEVWFVQFSNNGEYLASSSSDCTAIVWKVMEDGQLAFKHVLSSHHKPVSLVAWSPDDTRLLTCGNGEVLKLWDVETGTCLSTFGGHGFIVSSCAWFPDSKQLVCGSSEPGKGIYVWDCDGKEIKSWKGRRMPKVSDLAVTPDGEHLIVVSDKEIRKFNVETSTEQLILEAHSITSLSVSTNGDYFIVNLNSQEIHLWDVACKWDKPLRFVGHKQDKYVIRSCFGGLNSSFIASGSEDSQVYIWNRRDPKPIEILSGHLMTVNCVSWNPRRHRMLASASDDGTVRIWGPSKLNSHSK
ncbi:unnamed protein product [Linum tenue]|uniref:RNase H type-1 domain-containing protein n=1 Tax=Linum tenue TaxID=586396 RepID=A0AAV0KW62_9ROSI|nr:unnamed protein product [Linum tenue]